MLSVLYIEINAIAISILLLLYFNGNQADLRSLDQTLFNHLLFFTICILLFDTGMWLTDGQQFLFARALNLIFTTAYYLLTPLIAFFWGLYCDYKANDGKHSVFTRLPLYYIPLGINTFLVFLSLTTGWLFSISEGNVYQRGGFFFIHAILSAFYLFYADFIALRKARHTEDAAEKREYNVLALFLLPAIFGATLQYLVYGLSTTWIGATIGILSVYLNVQNRQISTDALTGINNRRQLGRYLRWKTAAIGPGATLYVVMLDVDNFKAINDTYGHIVGDEALIEVANLLKQVCSGRNDFLARLGGDEFTIVCQRPDAAALEITVGEINKTVAAFNESGAMPYRLSLSIGFAAFDPEKDASIDDFLSCADREMYCEKAARKHG
ncbi:MAG TPA: GGDEF domain-containing protein [Oscillospiraceae bacterium]|nr:GGDEF domain-containing protein [Oscillospiraceae bacterium]